MINTAEELRSQKIELEKTIAELRMKFDQFERRSAELSEAEEKKHTEEVQFLKKTNLQLKVKRRREIFYLFFVKYNYIHKGFIVIHMYLKLLSLIIDLFKATI